MIFELSSSDTASSDLEERWRVLLTESFWNKTNNVSAIIYAIFHDWLTLKFIKVFIGNIDNSTNLIDYTSSKSHFETKINYFVDNSLNKLEDTIN